MNWLTAGSSVSGHPLTALNRLGFIFSKAFIYFFKYRDVRFITVSELEILTFTSVHVKLFFRFLYMNLITEHVLNFQAGFNLPAQHM